MRGNAWTVKHMISFGHNSILEALRCNEVWPVAKTEELVKFYIDFVNWLSENTLGYVPRAIDQNFEKTKNRKLSYSSFLSIIQKLDPREKLMIGLFYYGEDRTVEEIISLKVDRSKSYILLQNPCCKTCHKIRKLSEKVFKKMITISKNLMDAIL